MKNLLYLITIFSFSLMIYSCQSEPIIESGDSVELRSKCDDCSKIQVEVVKDITVSDCCYYWVNVTNTSGCAVTYEFTQHTGIETVVTSSPEYSMYINVCDGGPGFYSISLTNSNGQNLVCATDNLTCTDEPGCEFCSGGGIYSGFGQFAEMNSIINFFEERGGAFICCDSAEEGCCFEVDLSILEWENGFSFKMQGDCSECSLSGCENVCLRTGTYQNSSGFDCYTTFDCIELTDGPVNYYGGSCEVAPDFPGGPGGPIWYFDARSAKELCNG